MRSCHLPDVGISDLGILWVNAVRKRGNPSGGVVYINEDAAFLWLVRKLWNKLRLCEESLATVFLAAALMIAFFPKLSLRLKSPVSIAKGVFIGSKTPITRIVFAVFGHSISNSNEVPLEQEDVSPVYIRRVRPSMPS